MTAQASSGNGASSSASADPSKFHPNERINTTSDVQLPEEIWLTVLDSPCAFGSAIFDRIMLNLIRNPNITSTHLFRADIFFDSSQYQGPGASHSDEKSIGQHLKPELRPKLFELPGWQFDKAIVRQLVPRNPQLDRPLVQTCVYLSRGDEHSSGETLVVYIPHVKEPDEMPFYHPRVEKLAFFHSHHHPPSPLGPGSGEGKISVSYKPFPSVAPNANAIDNKLNRTALKLLQTVHKHGQGQLAGYEKRVHHDQVIPQQRYQNTYTRLKAKYGRKLSESWVEVTDPGKHVFEDLGIAAFLLELWAEMYDAPSSADAVGDATQAVAAGSPESEALDEMQKGLNDLNMKVVPRETNGHRLPTKAPPFPGFVDIGCGNGLLVYILISEGYPGFGFDARERKTWSTFPSDVQEHLRQQILVPEVLGTADSNKNGQDQLWHDGVFSEGTFIVSNHADELTVWTPLLAYLNNSAFIAIPCCSHDLTGLRFRAPEFTKALKPSKVPASREHAPRLPQQKAQMDVDSTGVNDERRAADSQSKDHGNLHLTQAAETGSLKRTLVQKKMASAYSTLCSYVTSLSTTVGFEPEREVLRIPSTRNQSIIGRRRKVVGESMDTRRENVRCLVEEELGRSVDQVGREWIERTEQLARKPGSGH